jgi:acyl-coenzyme A thioesterase PaaI-like protein
MDSKKVVVPFAATLIDTIGSVALCTVSDKTSVSTNISAHYLLPIPVGDTAVVDATVRSLGRRMSTTEVLFM